jgi:HD-GYP domain-containing protein (c-di-GMP phosphodiesterase class II)
MFVLTRPYGFMGLDDCARSRDWQAMEVNLLGVASAELSGAIENVRLVSQQRDHARALEQAYDTTLEGWARALELRDSDTEGHTRRVSDMTVRLGGALGCSEAELIQLRRGALLHDMGKIAIPDSILRKPGPLDAEEWEAMRKHPTYAHDMLARIGFLKDAMDIPYCHHENWDGTGYPRGLKGEQIPLAARVFAVVDAWDALCSDRPYRKAWPRDEVVAYLREQSGARFDPQIIERFLETIA